MAEKASDARELVEELNAAPDNAAAGDAEFFPLNKLPNDLLVSVFAAAMVGAPLWLRHTFPCVCRAWRELFRTQDASPLHETLEVDFEKEVERALAVAARERRRRRDPVVAGAPPPFVVHASRVIAWAQAHAVSVRKLFLRGTRRGNFEDFRAEDLGALVAAVGSSLTHFSIGYGLDKLCEKPLWKSLRTSVAPAGRLRSFAIEDITLNSFEYDVEPLLGQLAGSLEELELAMVPKHYYSWGEGLLPASFFALKKLRRLALCYHPRITAIPADISSLKKLEELDLHGCDLSSLPKELVELSGLTKLDISGNKKLGTTLSPAEAFPAELGEMKSLRELSIDRCRLRTVPAFVGKLESLEILNLRDNDISSLPKGLGELSGLTKLDLYDNKSLGTTAAAFPAELGGMKSLRELDLSRCGLRAVPAFVGELKSLETLTLEHNRDLQVGASFDFLIEGCPRLRQVTVFNHFKQSRASAEAFKAKLRAKNPRAYVGW